MSVTLRRFGAACPLCVWLAWAAMALVGSEAQAVITVGTGNEPLRDPGWPQGADGVFNSPERVAWWEGPPFGGGHWHAEYRGDAAALSELLVRFATIDAPSRQLVVHDGAGHSFPLDSNRQQPDDAGAQIDWTFAVWVPANWQRLQAMPADIRPGDGAADGGPPAPRIDVYTGRGIRWDDVKVPDGIEVVDHRLEAHGYELADGTVLEGSVVDLTSGQPMPAMARLDSMESVEGEYRYTTVNRVAAGPDGRWVIKSAPAGRYRLVVEAQGYAPRVIAYEQLDDQPKWIPYETGLAPAVAVTGQVVDAQREPLAEVDVRLADVVGPDGNSYRSTDDYRYTTDEEGRFQASPVPQGRASIRVYKPGYIRPGLGLAVDTPASDVKLTMVRSAALEIAVNFGSQERPAGYLIQVEPEGGAAVGAWSASGNLGEDGTIRFENVPPGTYVITGRPNPGSEQDQTRPLTVSVKGGDDVRVAIKAR